VALEATGNSDAIANLLTPIVGRVVVSNPSKTRPIAEAKVKTDKVDARIVRVRPHMSFSVRPDV
jgi:transposase